MLHAFEKLDGKRKYIGSIGDEDFYLSIVTSSQEARKHPEAIIAISHINEDALAEQQKKIDQEGKSRVMTGINFAPDFDKDAVFDLATGYLVKSMNYYGSNQIMLVLENGDQKFVGMMLMNINQEWQRTNYKVSDEIKTFIFFDSIAMSEEYRGKGLFSAGFDKFMTMMVNPKRKGLEAPFQFTVSIMAANALEADGSEFNYALNLPAYAKMWNDRFTENSLQNRWNDHPKGPKKYANFIHPEHLPLESFTEDRADGQFRIDEDKVDEALKEQKEIAKETTAMSAEDKIPSCTDVRGFFLSGRIQNEAKPIAEEAISDQEKRKSLYLEVRENRKEFLAKKGIEKVKSKKTSWVALTSESSSQETPNSSNER